MTSVENRGDFTPEFTLKYGYTINRLRFLTQPELTVIIPSTDGRLGIWKPLSNSEPSVTKVATGSIYGMCFFRNKTLAALACSDNTIKVIDLSDLTIIREFTGHKGAVYDVLTVSDNSVLSVSADGTIRLWDLSDTGSTGKILRNYGVPLFSISHQMSKSTVAIALDDRRIVFWNTNSWVETSSITTFDSKISTISVARNYLAAGGHEGKVYIWDLEKVSTKNYKPFIIEKHDRRVTDVKLFHDAQFLATKSLDGSVKLWKHIANGNWNVIADVDELSSKNVFSGVDFHQSQYMVATLGDRDTIVRIWNIRSLSKEYYLRHPELSEANDHITTDTESGKLALKHRVTDVDEYGSSEKRQSERQIMDVAGLKFIFDVGYFAMAELKQIWKVRRAQVLDGRQDANTEINISRVPTSDEISEEWQEWVKHLEQDHQARCKEEIERKLTIVDEYKKERDKLVIAKLKDSPVNHGQYDKRIEECALTVESEMKEISTILKNCLNLDLVISDLDE